MSTHQKNAIVIGSGIAGIASAIRLAVQGFDVSVYEKNATPGGKLTSFSKNGFHFDAGPSLFTRPGNIEDLFELAGEPMENYFSYSALPVACKYFYEGGKQVTGFTNAEQFANVLMKFTQLQKLVLENILDLDWMEMHAVYLLILL